MDFKSQNCIVLSIANITLSNIAYMSGEGVSVTFLHDLCDAGVVWVRAVLHQLRPPALLEGGAVTGVALHHARGGVGGRGRAQPAPGVQA